MRNILEHPITRQEMKESLEEAVRLSMVFHEGEIGSIQPFALMTLLQKLEKEDE